MSKSQELKVIAQARGILFSVDQDSDVQVILLHACECGGCATVGFISAESAADLALQLAFVAKEAKIKRTTGQTGGCA